MGEVCRAQVAGRCGGVEGCAPIRVAVSDGGSLENHSAAHYAWGSGLQLCRTSLDQPMAIHCLLSLLAAAQGTSTINRNRALGRLKSTDNHPWMHSRE